MGRATNLQIRTMRIIYQRLLQVVTARGTIDKPELMALFRAWNREDTDIEAIATAGQIRKMKSIGLWNDQDWKSWERHHTTRFTASVKAFIRRMDKAGSNRFDRPKKTTLN